MPGAPKTSGMDIEAARAAAYAEPLENLHPGRPDLFEADAIWPVFERLRREDPVHWVRDGPFGPYWSVTTWDMVAAVDTDHEAFSSAQGVVLTALSASQQISGSLNPPMFMSMDPPRHQAQRRAVSPAFAPGRLAQLAPAIRRRAAAILDDLPRDETFDWVDRVARELTAATLAMLFDFDFEQRRLLTFWSDVITLAPGRGVVTSWDQKRDEIGRCFACFSALLDERSGHGQADDLVSLLAGRLRAGEMNLQEALGDLLLLIVAGADTTRNSISGSLYALSSRPGSYRRLAEEPGLITSMASETLRWQTPVAHMRRIATRDVELGGKTIRKGDSVAMWYASANRDEALFEDADDFVIDRPNARRHLSFGAGIHRCVGARLAELQLTILWEEILKRFDRIEVAGEPVRTHSVFIRGYEQLPVMIPS